MHQTQKKKHKERKIGKHRELRGRMCEENFLAAWSDRKNYPPWLRNVRKATRRENKFNNTDVVMQTTIGDINIQIKASLFGVSQVQRLADRGILPLCVEIFDTPDEIRTKTLEAIETFRIKKGLREFPIPQENPDHLAVG